jgi:hypothetical protein
MKANEQPQWASNFPNRDFQFSFRARPGDERAFFAPTENHADLIAARRHWLANDPGYYLLEEPVANPLIAETCRLAHEWGTVDRVPDGLRSLGERWEADFALLTEENGQYVMRAAVICFPSSWSPETKLGRPIHEIHVPVPTLNRDLGARIDTFLASLKPGAAWERANWGLSASPELNQHPTRDNRRLVPPFGLEEAWVRIEDQILLRLPETGGILFGIRLQNLSLVEIRQHPQATAGLHRAIATMPDEVAEYKSITQSREHLLELLAD